MTTMKDDNTRVREWELGLPSAADLPPLSHSLISRVLARAFCIPASSASAPSAADVLQASQSTLLSLHRGPPVFNLPSFDPYNSYEPGGGGGEDGGGDGGDAAYLEEGTDEDRGGHDTRKEDVGRRSGHRVAKSPMAKKGSGWESEKVSERDGVCSGALGIGGIGNGNLGPDYTPFYWGTPGVMPGGSGPYGSMSGDQGGYGGLEAASESTKGASMDKSRKLVDTESEDADSADGPDGNAARTLKRPRLVWTPQLHKRFVDAVGHLGIKNAVPKTIMQLMNVEGLTRENVASHLQKYRLYLKRMQGLSTEGPSASDPLFASTPLPPNLSPFPQSFSSHHHSRGESGVTGPPFSPPTVPMPQAHGAMGAGPVGPVALGPGPVSPARFGAYEHHPYSIGLARSAPQRPPNMGEHREFVMNPHAGQPGSGSPPHRILTLFPPSGH